MTLTFLGADSFYIPVNFLEVCSRINLSWSFQIFLFRFTGATRVMFSLGLIILYHEARPFCVLYQYLWLWGFPVLLIGIDTISCVNIVNRLYSLGDSFPGFCWQPCMHGSIFRDYSRATLCRSLEFSVHLSPFCYFLLQILGAFIFPDSQQCLLNSTNLSGCAVIPFPA